MLKNNTKDLLNKFNKFNKLRYKTNYLNLKILNRQLINLLSVNHKLLFKFNNPNKIIPN